VRTSSLHPARLARTVIAASLFVVAAGCAGGSGSALPNPGSNGICDPTATGIQLARPTPGFPANGNNIEIVVNGNSDQLATSSGQFDLILRDQFNGEIDTGFLSPFADPSGPHPYNSDFFYQGTLSTSLLGGRTYSVFLNAPSTNCTPGFVGTIQT